MSYNEAMPSTLTLGRLAAIAEDQWGLATRRQAESAGVPQATLTRLIRSGVLERVAHGVYRLAGAPATDHLDLRAAWLQLAPETPSWERSPEQGVVSHRSAAALYGIGDLPGIATSSRCRGASSPAARMSACTWAGLIAANGSHCTACR
jgi:predicted transcriptional regulator of viral defense system